MRNKSIVLFDNLSGGHHETYVSIYAKNLLELGNKVLIFYPRDDIFLSLKKQYGDQIKIVKTNIDFDAPVFKNKYLVIVSNILSTILIWIKINSTIKKGIKELQEDRVDLVFFLWLDSFLNEFLRCWMVNLFFKFKWAGLYFHPRDMRIDRRLLIFQKPNNILKSKFCKFIAILDEGVVDKLSSCINKKVYVFPDVTDETIEQNNQLKNDILDKAKGRKIIGMFGGLSKYKGLLSLIETIKKADSKKYFFIIAGKIIMHDFNEKEAKVIDNFLGNKPSNCLFIFERIASERSFNMLVDSCDILLAVYENFPHSSNILTKAALFNKFVITSNRYLMAERVKKFQLGICIEQENPTKLLGAIKALLQESKTLQPRFEIYFSEHSQRKLLKILSEIEV